MSGVDRLEGDRELIDGLRRLGDAVVVPPVDPMQEQRLLAAFDEHHACPSRLALLRARSGLAVLLAAVAMLAWLVLTPHSTPQTGVRLTSETSQTRVRPASETSQTGVRPASETSQTPLRRAKPKRPSTDSRFVMWPGADELPRFESGQLMRVELPASVVVSLGLRPPRPLRMDGTVQTDVLVGQDGYARAVRLVQ